MAEATAVAAPAVAPADAAKSGKSKLLMIVVVVLAVGAGVVGGTMFLGAGGGEEAAAAVEPEPEEGAVVPVSQMTVSLNDAAAHFARVEFAAVLDASVDGSTVEAKFPLLEDAALNVIMGFSAEELRTVAGADELRAELTARAQDIYADGEVLRIVLTELIVQ